MAVGIMTRGRPAPQKELFTARNLLTILAFTSMIGSFAYWWGVQSVLTNNKLIAAAYTLILVLAPPSLTSFIIPWSPAGMLLQKINAKTIGYPVIVASSLILLWYSYTIQTQWWATQPVVAQSNIVQLQVLIGLIGFIFVPALLWTPVNSEELVEKIRQAHLVRKYELQTQADIAILRSTLLKAQEKALIGFANLTIQEREELALTMRGIVRGIDTTMKEMADSIKTVAGATAPFASLTDNEDIKGYLEYVSDSILDAAPLPEPKTKETAAAKKKAAQAA